VGDYEGARQRYEAAVATGAQDPRLLYNLANATYKTGDLGRAIVWYERALRLAPRDEDIQANLRFLRRLKKDRDPDPTSGIGGVLERAFMWPTLNELALAWMVSLLACFATVSWRRWQGQSSLHSSVLGCAAVALFVALVAFTRFEADAGRIEAVVTEVQGIARSGPDGQETEVFVIHEGTKVVVERSEGTWHLVRLDSGLGGWLPSEVITKI
jgi:tetratricopeptide (TPR) repeat protein